MIQFLALLVLAFLGNSLATECIANVCSHAFAACNNTGHPTQGCWDWADEVFHCCDHCADCKAPKKEQAAAAAAAAPPASSIERHCHPTICDTVLKACYKVHDNTSQCQERADKISHCCYSCMDCPPEKTAAAEPIKVAEAAIIPKESEVDMERHCHPKICDTVLKTCYKVHDNTSECQERADKASHCCYSCMDCPPVTPKAKDDTCKANFCEAVWNVCTASGDYKPDECWKISDDAAGCCDECGTCSSSSQLDKKHHEKHHGKEKHHHKKQCQQEACEKSFHVCRSWLGVQEHKACWDLVDDTFNCCNRCHSCDDN